MSQPEKDKVMEQPWLKQAVNELRQPATPSVAGQLRAVRRTALAQESVSKQSLAQRLGLKAVFLPGVAFAMGLGAVAVAVLLLFDDMTISGTSSQLQAQASSGNVLLEDLPIMASQDELQFYQDLELLQWLAQEDGLGARS